MDAWGYGGTIISCVIAYLIGSISWSLIIGRCAFHVDVRNYCSKNAGATNATRILGKKWGIIIMVLDMCKVPIAMVIAMALSAINVSDVNSGQTSLYCAGLFTIIGHCFPVFFKFKGGKGVSCFIGFSWMISPYYFLIFAGIWWILFFSIKRVSLSSIAGTACAIILCWVPQISMFDSYQLQASDLISNNILWFESAHNLNFKGYADSLYLINACFTISGLLLIGLHHANIVRLCTGKEPKFTFSKDKSVSIKQPANI